MANKTDNVPFRITLQQKVILSRLAESTGRTLSGWIRYIVLKEAGLLPKANQNEELEMEE